ncbi:transmembrane protein 81 isoform X2 [Chiloscyllium punctatum]|uniref:transmembrane protein 81 isoform X2 n=1 Tax=Chiloscyllium punctatum TaxID=137246 RepID=UPI003B63681B
MEMLVPHADIYRVLSFAFLIHLATFQEDLNTLPPNAENVTITGNLLAVEEKHAGTYMCQVQNSKTMQIVKRVLIGVRVIPEKLVQLNYYEVLSPEQKEELAILQGNPVKKKSKSFFAKVKALFKSANMAVRVIAIGLAIGGACAFVLGAIFLCMTNY